LKNYKNAAVCPLKHFTFETPAPAWQEEINFACAFAAGACSCSRPSNFKVKLL
jgi:hypothetical protein